MNCCCGSSFYLGRVVECRVCRMLFFGWKFRIVLVHVRRHNHGEYFYTLFKNVSKQKINLLENPGPFLVSLGRTFSIESSSNLLEFFFLVPTYTQ